MKASHSTALNWVMTIVVGLFFGSVFGLLLIGCTATSFGPTPAAYRTAPNEQGIWQGLNGLWYDRNGWEVPDPNTGRIQR